MSPRIPRRTVLVAVAVLLGVALAAGGLLTIRGLRDEPVRVAAVQPVTTTPPATSPSTPTTTPPAPAATTAPPPPVTTTTTPPPPPKPTTSTTTRRTTTTTKSTPRADTSLAGQVLALVNAERTAAGCGPLSTDSRLATAAQKHSDDMSARGYFSHTTPEGVSFADRIKAAGYPSPGAENIAKGSTTAEQTMEMWMNSDGHRRNILNCSYTKLGVGVAKSGWYWTQNFGF
ncbi:CAP domain-containing protein [Amycolatopsis thermoflava]|uniref:CAP domain-containing protein n=1 Tax=Amycolatopsis thermoflava TaxID=84480 RepID=UPI0038117822